MRPSWPVWLVKDSGDFDRMLDEELLRLQTDHVDYYLMHSLDRGGWAKVQKLGLLQKAEDAVKDGRIRYIGFSFHDKLDIFKQIVDGYDKWTFCQIQYNYMDIEFQAGTAGLHYAAEKDLAVVIMEPLRGGRLAADLPAAQPIWAEAKTQHTPADWALQWLWNQPEVFGGIKRHEYTGAGRTKPGFCGSIGYRVAETRRAGYDQPCPRGFGGFEPHRLHALRVLSAVPEWGEHSGRV